MIEKDLYKTAQIFFEKTKSIPEVFNVDQTIQFNLKDYENFHVVIKNGNISVRQGMVEPDIWNVLNLKTDKNTLMEMLDGRRTLAEAMYDEKVQIVEMAKKPVTSWFGRLIRKTQEAL